MQHLRPQRPVSSVEPGRDQQKKAKQQFSGGISQLDERTDMTSLNKDSTFEREELSEMLSAGKRTVAADNTIGGNSRR